MSAAESTTCTLASESSLRPIAVSHERLRWVEAPNRGGERTGRFEFAEVPQAPLLQAYKANTGR